MNGNYFDPGTGDHVLVDGNIVERDTLHIVERIKEYDEDLDVMCLDPDFISFSEAPFVVVWRRPDGSLVKVFEAWSLDEKILERIYLADNRKFDGLDRIVSMEEAQKKLTQDRYKDRVAENKEIVEAAIKNTKSSFVFRNKEDELVKIHEDKPPTYGEGKIITHGRSHAV